MTSATGTPLIKLTSMYENRSQKTGDTYFVGVAGGAKFLVLRDKKAERGQPGWTLFIAPRPERAERRKEPSA